MNRIGVIDESVGNFGDQGIAEPAMAVNIQSPEAFAFFRVAPPSADDNPAD
jgi:hypothetical protein